jgi:predicted NAD-dependent protein-ADP-ribosyltransferase YbiA (DUF1768 family)
MEGPLVMTCIYCKDTGFHGEAGQKVTLRKDWEGVKIQVMRDVLRLKFANPGLRDRLLETGDRELIEGNTWGDTFWGVCRGSGKNWLGQLLMELRGELSK